jgi:sensor histidine kinase YesM
LEESTPFTYSAELKFSAVLDSLDFIELRTQGLSGNYKIYWDETVIKEVKSKSTSSDLLITTIRLKHRLTSFGTHILKIISEKEQNSMSFTLVYADKYRETKEKRDKSSFFMAGIYSLASIFMFALFLGTKAEKMYLFFGLYSLLNVIKVLPILFLNEIALSHYEFKSPFFWFTTVSWPFMLALFLFYFYEFKKRAYLIGIAAIASISFYYTGIYSNVLIYVFLIPFSFYALKRNKEGSLTLTLALVLCSILMILSFEKIFPSGYWIANLLVLFAFTFAISQKIQNKNDRLKAMELSKSKLESDLLKKSIQPHFIMNTLLSIMAWIPKKTSKALELIKSLANEFKLIYHYSDKDKIPINEELNLCKNHLDLMNIRLDTNHVLTTRNIDESEEIPPLIIHTLIENALTHSFKINESGFFNVSFIRQNKLKCYTIENNGSQINTASSHTEEGLGLKYIRTRLTERYQDNYTLSYGVNSMANWYVKIEIKC